MNPYVFLVYALFMDHLYFQNTKQLQEWIIKNGRPDDIVLTSGGRMARQIIHRYREHKSTSGTRCWLPIKVLSLNDWLKSFLNNDQSKNKVREWDNLIHEIWIKLRFPVLAREEDQTSWDHLREGIMQINRDLYDEEMPLGKYL